MKMSLTWADFKAQIAAGLPYKYLSIGEMYYLYIIDSGLEFECLIRQNGGDDQTDFEANYKTAANKIIGPRDTSGVPLARTTVTKNGWHYDPRSISFRPGKLNSLVNKKSNGTAINDAALKFFDNNFIELVQGENELDAEFQLRLDANCVHTYMDWWPQYDMDIRGALFFIKDNTSSDPSYFYAIVAPDVPAMYGGSVPFGEGGFDISFLDTKDKIIMDAAGSKLMAFDATYKTNKIRLAFEHPLAPAFALQVVYQHYRA